MTENEIKETREWLQDFIRTFGCNFDDLETRGFNECVMFLKELEQYRAIGTVEDFKALKEKNEPKKPIDKIMYLECPACGDVGILDCGYCSVCGQALDWN